MSDGSFRSIEQVEANDQVMSRDEGTGQNRVGRVVRTFQRRASELVRVRLKGGEQIEATPEHPFYVKGKGFVAAKWLRAGLLLSTLGGTVPVEAASPVKRETVVYNFEVEKHHTYFVGANQAWVHNACFHKINWKGFASGQLKIHYEKHVVLQKEFGEITQNEYLRKALAFAKEQGDATEVVEGNFLIKYDSATRRMIVGHSKKREIRTFYIADSRSTDPLKDAIDFARGISNG